MRGGAIFSGGVIGSVVVVEFCKSGVAFTSGRGVIVMVVQLTWSCLCPRSGGANYLEVLVLRVVVQLTNGGCGKRRCGARIIIRSRAHR